MSALCATNLLCSEHKIKKPIDIQSGLEKLKLLVCLTEGAIDSFLKKNLSHFDALVGENACELRASYILDLIDQGTLFTDTLVQTLEKVNKIKTCLSDVEWVEKASSDQKNYQIDLQTFVQTMGLNFDISEEEAFLVQSFLLTQTKEVDENHVERSNPQLLQKLIPELSGKFCKSLVKETQKQLSWKSVKYIQKEAQLIQSENQKKLLSELTSDPFVLEDDHGRVAAPCYFALKTVMTRMWEKKELILYKIHAQGQQKPMFLLFKPGKDLGVYEEIPVEESLAQVAAIWEGTSKLSLSLLRDLFTRLTPFGIFSMNNAQHPAYFGKNKGNKIALDKTKFKKRGLTEIAIFQAFAHKMGCHASNQAVFFHDHSFCDQIGNQVKSLEISSRSSHENSSSC